MHGYYLSIFEALCCLKSKTLALGYQLKCSMVVGGGPEFSSCYVNTIFQLLHFAWYVLSMKVVAVNL